jgi:pimeloyl-ACP methyl ester carboxylesterase
MYPKLLILAATLATTSWGAPCLSVKEGDCTEWIKFPGGSAKSLVYRTYPLETRNQAITRVLIMVHGAGRDADNYFRTALAAGFLAGALDDTLIVAPRFASNNGSCRDVLQPGEVNWSCSGNSWRSGGNASGSEKLTSFDFADEILRKVARKDVFPNVKAIVVAGHSAGGQFVNRYEMANRVHDTVGVPVTYVVSNPSSYAYLDPLRPASGAWAGTAAPPGYLPTPTAGDLFRAFSDARNCSSYDQWPYGLGHRTGYTAAAKDDQLKQQVASRPTTYLLGELDILPLGGFDGSCPAMAQGPTRLARGEAFSRYVGEKYGAKHKMVVVPLCGHNARCMFTAEAALPVVFPR